MTLALMMILHDWEFKSRALSYGYSLGRIPSFRSTKDCHGELESKDAHRSRLYPGIDVSLFARGVA